MIINVVNNKCPVCLEFYVGTVIDGEIDKLFCSDTCERFHIRLMRGVKLEKIVSNIESVNGN